MRCPVRLICLMVLVLSAPLSAAELGSIDFPNSGAEEAQTTFVRSVLLLHSFEYEDARESFRETQRLDPDFALAYWGEAMTHNHPLWRQQDREAALEALERFAPTPEQRQKKIKTERERGYLAAVDALYGEGEKRERDQAYSDAMRRLSEQFPDDLEARSFYALSILGTVQGERDFAVYMRAGATAEEVFDLNPNHPGALHYMIHSYDDPVHAPLGLRAARVYAKVAPAASHAQHMISHIYVALGHWEESAAANVKSFDVSVERRERKQLGIDAMNFHSLQWLEYSYLQLGRFEEAWATLEQMTDSASSSGSDRALWYHAAMRAAWIVESGGKSAPEAIGSEETPITGAAANLFAAGYAALRAGNPEKAEQEAMRIGTRRDVASAGPLCDTSAGFGSTSKTDLIVAEVLQKNLMAMVELERGHMDIAVELLRQATALEAALPMEFGPPAIVKPSHELFGEVLLKLDQPAAALEQFQVALSRAPRRSLSLKGMAAAASATGQSALLAKSCDELRASYRGADVSVSLPEVCRQAAAQP